MSKPPSPYLTDARSLLLLVGNEQQAPGGIEDDPDLKHLRGPLLNAPIGLRALPSEYYRPPHAIPREIRPKPPNAASHQHVQTCQSPLNSCPGRAEIAHTCLCTRSQCAKECPTSAPTRCTACSTNSCFP